MQRPKNIENYLESGFWIVIRSTPDDEGEENGDAFRDQDNSHCTREVEKSKYIVIRLLST